MELTDKMKGAIVAVAVIAAISAAGIAGYTLANNNQPNWMMNRNGYGMMGRNFDLDDMPMFRQGSNYPVPYRP